MDLKNLSKTTNERFVKVEKDMTQMIGIISELVGMIKFISVNYVRADVSSSQQSAAKANLSKPKKYISNYNGLKN